jgi:hypothetical protein
MNPAAILALLSNLYEQIVALQTREQELLARIAELEKPPAEEES